MNRYEIFLYSFHDHTGIARHLEKMAEKGWLLDSTGFFWKYRKAEPQELHYAVTYFPASSDFDPAPSDKEYLFRDFCESAGWEFVAQAGQMRIFRNEGPDPVPLDTEPMVQVETIHASMRSSHLKSQAGLASGAVILLMMVLVRLFTDPLSILKYSGYLLAVLSEVFLLAEVAWETVSYFRWRKRALAAAEEGRFLPTPGWRWPKIMNLLLTCGFLAGYLMVLDGKYLGAMTATLGAILGSAAISSLARKRLKAKGVKGSTNKAVTTALGGGLAAVFTIVLLGSVLASTFQNRYDDAEEYEYNGVSHYVYHDPLPLYMEDLVEVNGSDYSNRLFETGSFLLKETQVSIHRRFDRREDPSAPDLMSYTLWSSPVPAILDLAVEDRLDWYEGRTALGYHYEPISAASGAQAAWQLYDGEQAVEQYLLRFDTHVMELDFDFTPTGEQMAAAIEKLLAC